MNPRFLLPLLFLLAPGGSTRAADDAPTREAVTAALRKAATFMHSTVAAHGGYAWTSSLDGKLRHGEGNCGQDTIWLQPPGTPAVGLAFLDAYEATGDEVHLKAATDTARALVKSQLRSGGWNYRAEFDPAKRREFAYRDGERGGREFTPATPAPGGWDVWRKRQHKDDVTVLDDDTTPAALRLLVRVDAALKFRDEPIHDAALYALESLTNAQYPIGAWSHNYDRFPAAPPDEKHYPVKKASYPEKWSRTWTKDFAGCYMLNDRITQNAIRTLLVAYRVYGEKKYLAAAEKGGKFLLLAQLPDPQPAWAQQYDRNVQPVWDRKFEPPAITGLESQDVLETLLLLYRETGNEEYLKPVPKALAYLKKCVLPDGNLPRFLELQTNKPLYFTKDYKLTFDRDEVPTHYGFWHSSRLDAIEAEYKRLAALKPGESREPPAGKVSAAAVRKVLAAQSASGAWAEPGFVRDAEGRKVTPKEGVIESKTFVENVATLCRYLKESR
jgi:PelA/Pel-15E family pectate lyase